MKSLTKGYRKEKRLETTVLITKIIQINLSLRFEKK